MYGLWLAQAPKRRLEREADRKRRRQQLNAALDVICVLRDRANGHAAKAMVAGLYGDWLNAEHFAFAADTVAELEVQHVEYLRFFVE